MMAFITPFFKKFKYYTLITSMLGMLTCAMLAHASSDIQAEFIEARYTDEMMLVNARYKIMLNATLEEALNNGVSLPFLYEIEITRPRWYALYRDMFGENLQRSYRLSFHTLTRQYRLSQGSYYRGFTSLDEALSALGILRNWRMLEGYISAKNYQNVGARIRMRLDVSQLPRPYQIITLGNTQWSLESPWYEFRPQLEELTATGVKA